MAAYTPLAASFLTYQATGNREDLTDFITDISPLEAPMYDRIGTVSAKARVHDWQTDSLDAAATNVGAEGEGFAAVAITPTNRYSNRCQVMTKQFTVSDTQNIVSKAGRTSETAYQLTKASKALKRDFEFTLFMNTVAASGGAGGNSGDQMMNVHGWQLPCSATSGTTTNSTFLTASASCVLTEVLFNDHLARGWNWGAKPTTVYVNGGLKRVISSWATSTGRVWDGGKKVTNVLSVYESDFGVLETVLDRYVPSNTGFTIDDNLYKKAILVPVKAVPLAKRGLAQDSMLWTQWTIESRNPSGNGMFYAAVA